MVSQQLTVAHNGKICEHKSTTGNFTTMNIKENITVGHPISDGELTDLYFWKRKLNLQEAQLFTKDCNQHSINKTNMLIDWDNLDILKR